MDKQIRLQARNVAYETGHHIQVTGGIPHANNTWLYTNNLTLRDKNPDTSWFYHFAADNTPPGPNTTWTQAGHGTHLSVKDIPGIAHTPGYYYIASRFPFTNPLKIVRFQFTGIIANKQIALRGDCYEPVTFQPLILPNGFRPEITLRFSGTGIAYLNNNNFQDPDDFRLLKAGKPTPLLPGTALAWAAAGKKTVTLTAPGNQTRTLTLDIARITPAEEETILPVNANDTDNTDTRDYKKENLNGGIPDPELRKIEFLLECPRDNEQQPPHWRHPLHEDTPPINTFLQNLKNRPSVAILLTRTKDTFQLHASNIKYGNQTKLLINEEIYDPHRATGLFLPSTPGNGLHRFEIQPTTTLTDLRSFFSNLYLEGIRESEQPRDAELKCAIQTRKTGKWETIASGTSPVTTLRLRINYSPTTDDIASRINHPDWLPFPDDPLNIVYNPSVILLPNPNEPAPSDPGALFEIEEPEILTVAPHYADLIEWNITSMPNTHIPFHANTTLLPNSMGETTGGNAVFLGPSHGTQIQLTGTAPGFIRIGLKLRGMNTDYLQFHVLVAPEIKIPYAFQFFTETPQHAQTQKITEAIANTPDIINICNILLRQVCMKLIPAPPSQIIPHYRLHEHRAPLDNTLTTNGALGLASYAKFENFPLEIKAPGKYNRLKIVNANNRTLAIGKYLLNKIPCILETRKNPAYHLLPLPHLLPPGFFNANQPLYVAFDSPQLLPFRADPHLPILIHYTTPAWISKGGGDSITHFLSALPRIYNINVVEKIDNSGTLGITTAIPPHHIATPAKSVQQIICENKIARNTLVSSAPSFRLRKNIIAPPAPPATQSIPYDFHGCTIDLNDNFFPAFPGSNVTAENTLFEAADTIVHEFSHSCGLEHRSYNNPKERFPDEVISNGYLPHVDVDLWELNIEDFETCNHKNLLTPHPIHSLDLDLTQAVLMRNSIFPPPANP